MDQLGRFITCITAKSGTTWNYPARRKAYTPALELTYQFDGKRFILNHNMLHHIHSPGENISSLYDFAKIFPERLYRLLQRW